MIVIVSSNPTERLAFGSVCDSHGWPYVACDSVRSFRSLVRHAPPHAVLVRNKLVDGYSDDVLAALAGAGLLPGTRTIVLIAAGTPSAHEARQVALGADCVHRDPVRADVVAAYLRRYRADARTAPGPQDERPRSPVFPFAGATLRPSDRTATRDERTTTLTPREIAFAELLAERQGEVVSYHVLYAELLGRCFAGDTTNMRVLLGKLDRSLRAVGVNVRRWIEVIPKSGYRYHPEGIPGRARTR